eukprot:1519875-Pyramimonas_sp.AAC.1
MVFKCSEVTHYCKRDGLKCSERIGPQLVGKETLHEENLAKARFHERFCKTQGEAARLAKLFNRYALQSGLLKFIDLF